METKRKYNHHHGSKKNVPFPHPKAKETMEFVLDLVDPKSITYRNRKAVADRLLAGRKATIYYKNRSEIKKLESKKTETKEKIKVEVTNCNTLDAAAMFSLKTKTKVLILNLASDMKPGGGWLKWSVAQEEECFKPTSYFFNIEPVVKEAYPVLKQDERIEDRTTPLSIEGAIYCPDVYWFRGNMDEDYPIFKKWNEHAFIDFVAVPALRFKKHGKLSEEDRKITLEKMRTIFDVAVAHSYKSLVLGAMGCGVYKNDPVEISTLFKQVIAEYEGTCISNICFAILQTSSRSANFDIFAKVFS